MLQWAAWLCSWPDGFASGVHRYVQGFHPDMMEVVYSWGNGARVVDICSMPQHSKARSSVSSGVWKSWYDSWRTQRRCVCGGACTSSVSRVAG